MAGRIAYYGNIVTNGLVLLLDAAKVDSYPKTGTTWRDISGNGNNGTLTNGPTFNSGNGGSIVFDGVNDYVELGNILNLGTNSLTINQWLYTSAYQAQVSLSKSLAGPSNYRFATGIGYPATNKMYIFMQGNGGADVERGGSTVLPLNTWFMATYVFDRATALKMYYNTIQETLTSSGTISQWNNLNFQSNNPFRIGSYTAGDNTTPSFTWQGRIGITQVYFRTLSDAEILQNYNATKSRYGL